MTQIGQLTFVALDGEAPDELELDQLPEAAVVAATVQRTYGPFGSHDFQFIKADGSKALVEDSDGLHLIYFYGHAWTEGDELKVCVKRGDSSNVLSLSMLLDTLSVELSPENLILVFDCCHARAAHRFVEQLENRLTVYGCSESEKSIALINENSSRLSLTIERELSNAGKHADLEKVFSEVARHLDVDGVIVGQSVSIEPNGEPVVLDRKHISPSPQRTTTVRRVRNRLLAAGGVFVAILVGFGWYVWNHTLLEVDLADLSTIATDVDLTGTIETPSLNKSLVFVEKEVSGKKVRLWVPSGNIILRVRGKYADEKDRSLSQHFVLTPGFNFFEKFQTWRLPAAGKIEQHPDMAYIPKTLWIGGGDRSQQSNDAPYWIDIRPPTVTEYLVTAHQLLQSGKLKSDESFILTAQKNSDAVEATGLDQLKGLNSDLGDILGVLQAGTSSEVAAPGDLAVGLGELACDNCPAPMTRREAKLYCESRKMNLPTDKQWELAVRGVDGRTFPWGDQFDPMKANVPGLPDKGDPAPALKPVFDYTSELSPFGLFDTVGNAGDWVINSQGAYEAVYMGATYRFNPEDATAFSLLPMTEETSLVREITARCVVP